MRSIACALLGFVLAGWLNDLRADAWPQFRGPNASGLAAGSHKLPAEIGPDQNLLWKTPLPPGHSGPVVAGERVYLTAVQGQRLLTIGLDRQTGKVLWQAEAPHKGIEKFHPSAGSAAQPTPATDGERVVSLFGSAGLFCYDPDGKLLWHLPLGPFKNDFGAGSSPVIVGDRIILNQDHDTDSFLMAIDKRTGKPIWKTDRSEFPRSYATPLIWEVNGKKQIVISGTLRTIGYDLETGKEIWTVGGLARIINMTPSVGPDNTLLLPAWAPGGDDTNRIEAAPYEEMKKDYDKDGNGSFEEQELPKGELRQRFTQIDRDKDGHITKDEYEYMRRIFLDARNVFLAIKPGGEGDITTSHVRWSWKRHLPYVPSPLYVNGCVFFVKNGGICSCLDGRTGKPTKEEERVFGKSSYYASPVGGDGKIYLIDDKGHLSVISAQPKWRELHKARFDEPTYATPAIAAGRIYLRTNRQLYCFGLPEAK